MLSQSVKNTDNTGTRAYRPPYHIRYTSHGLHILTAVSRLTQPSTLCGMVNGVTTSGLSNAKFMAMVSADK